MDYEKAAAFWTKEDEKTKKMGDEELHQEIETFVKQRRIMSLGTADHAGHVDVTPIEYTYMGGFFYLLSEGGRKFALLQENKNVAFSIASEDAFPKLESLQVEGKASIIETDSPEYRELLSFKGIPLQAIESLKSPLYCIKIQGTRYVYLNSAFKEKGFGVRQTLSED